MRYELEEFDGWDELIPANDNGYDNDYDGFNPSEWQDTPYDGDKTLDVVAFMRLMGA